MVKTLEKCLTDLKILLKECHDLGYLTEAFAIQATKVAYIHYAKKDFSWDAELREDTISHFYYKLVRKWKMLDPKKSPLSYLNAMLYTSLLDIAKKEKLYKDKKARLREFTLAKLNIQEVYYDNNHDS